MLDERKKAAISHKYHLLRSGKDKETQHKEALSGVYGVAKRKAILKRIKGAKGYGK